MNILDRIAKGIFLMDGAMGTQIQGAAVPNEAWPGKEGCNELLNLTAPDIIRNIHQAYFKAGSDAVETNTFGATPITLGEYDLSDKAFEINKAAAQVAREAAEACASADQPRYVFGSIGPGTKLPTLGQVSFDDLCDGLQIQIEGLAAGGADGIIIETCQDLLQIKAALVAYDKVLGIRSGKALYVSVTVEQTGTLLIGSNIGAVVATLAPYPIDILGLNCATGPEAMRIHLDYLKDNWPRRIACMPNAGLPVMKAGGVEYPLQPDEYSQLLGDLARDVGLSVVGGCCGTTPAHMTALRKNLEGFVAPERDATPPDQASSVFSPVDLSQEPRPLYVGERANATGSRKFRDTLLANDYESAFGILSDQEEKGAHLLDLSCAYAGRDETDDIRTLVSRAAKECRLPLMIDTTQTAVVEEALKLYGGRVIINSINFESGEDRADTVTNLARQFGAGLVCLTIDEVGMAMTADRKVDIAKRLVAFCEERGLKRGDLLIDTLTFTIGSGDDTLRDAATQTLEAIKRVKEELPGTRTILGLSNISFGLKPAGRKVLNTVFLDLCLKAGLDAAIINVATIVPLNEIPYDAAQVALALLQNDTSQGDPLENFINFFEDLSPADIAAEEEEAKTPEEALTAGVVKGKVPKALDVLPALLEKYEAEHILNEILVPAMKEVGRLFNDGILQLPFVLKSAEVMKKSVDVIKPHMKKDESSSGRGTMVLATVSGDVHDIGKNLVDIILSNNGFNVVNLGTKIGIQEMISAVRQHKANVLGMSGLLVKSAAIMAENLKALEDTDIHIPVFLGGAALTPGYVADGCQPGYSAPVVYCKDAFEGLAYMRELADGATLPMAQKPEVRPQNSDFEAPAVNVDLSGTPPEPPFWGHKIVEDINLHDVYPLVNEIALMRGRWGYRRGKTSSEEYQKLMETEVLPLYEKMKIDGSRTGLLKASAAYGYFKCRSEGESLFVYPKEGADPIEMVYPRQNRSPHLSIPDFFRRDEDVVGFMVVTLGAGLESENMRLLKENEYREYFLLHGFAVEVTDALAEFWHERMRRELGYDEPKLNMQGYITQKYRGSRYGFGYPACPDLTMNRVCCDLVHAENIGVTVTENFMMAPEVTTSALIAHHPQAKYFNA